MPTYILVKWEPWRRLLRSIFLACKNQLQYLDISSSIFHNIWRGEVLLFLIGPKSDHCVPLLFPWYVVKTWFNCCVVAGGSLETVCWQLNDSLLTAWWQLVNSLMTAYWQLGVCLMYYGRTWSIWVWIPISKFLQIWVMYIVPKEIDHSLATAWWQL